MTNPDQPRGALKGIRVLEIGEMVSAPYASRLLADLGADVIKIEGPEGDRARSRGPFPPGRDGNKDASGLYLALNTGKQSVVVDPTNDHATTIVERLVADADIIITNHSTGQLAELGFDPDQALAQRPELVICSISAFGRSGPYAHYRAEELTVTHAGGWAYQSPGASLDVDQPPLKVFGHQTDFHAGMAAAMVCLAAFDKAELTGTGDHIDFSSMAHTAGMLEAALIAASYMNVNPNRLGSRILNPWKILECAPTDDGRSNLIFLVTVEPDQWQRLVELMGNPEWVETGLFETTELRLENEDLLITYLQEWTSQHTVDEIWHRGQENRICFAPVLAMADMAQQEHLAERQFFVEIEHPETGPITHLGLPFLATPRLSAPARPAPSFDEQTDPRFADQRCVPADEAKGVTADSRPLAGRRVLDFSWVWAGPYCTMHLAHLGAEVIKVESSLRPGLGRRLPIHPLDVEPTLNTSAYFNQWEQGKQSCSLDLSKPEAIEIVKELVKTCDVVVENFATGVMDRLGLDYETLSSINPNIVVASISGYGGTGPLKHYMGYGPTTGPLSGLTSLTGYIDGPPQELGLSIGDPGAGITAAFAICAALAENRVSGRGCYLDVALWESTATNAIEGWMHHELTGSPPARAGNRDSIMAPHGVYRTGPAFLTPSEDLGPDPGLWISIACATDDEWQALAGLIDSDLMTDPRFATEAERKTNEDALDQLIQSWVEGQDHWTLTKELQAVGVAAFPSMSPFDLLNDEHLNQRGFFERLEHPEVGRRTHAGVPWISKTGPNGVASPAPLLGQHTDRVLVDLLGMSDTEVVELRRNGIIG